MSFIEKHVVYRVKTEFIEVMEGTDTSKVRAVQQAVRFATEFRDHSLTGRLCPIFFGDSQKVHLPSILEQQTFRDGNSQVVMIGADSAAELPIVRREVERLLPYGWHVVPIRYRQRQCQESANQGGVKVISLVGGVLRCLVS